MKRIIWILSIVIMLVACHSKDVRKFNAQENIYIDIDKRIDYESMYKSLYVNNVTYIPLETADDFLIGRIKKLIFDNSYIYIFDDISNKLYQFYESGKYANQIGNIGEGPKEYMKISSFSIDSETGNIFIYCEIKQSVFEYDSSGDLLNIKRVGLGVNDIFYAKNTYWYYASRTPNESFYRETFPMQYRLVGIDKNELRKEYLPFEYNSHFLKTALTSSGENCFYLYNDKIRFKETSTNYVYEINDSIYAVYSIDFGKYTIPVDFYEKSADITEEKIRNIENSNYCQLSDFFETDKYIYINYSISHYDYIICSSLYLKDNKQTINLGHVWINYIDNISVPRIISTKNNDFIGYLDADEIKTMIATNNNKLLSQKMLDLDEKLSEADNPVICIIEMK